MKKFSILLIFFLLTASFYPVFSQRGLHKTNKEEKFTKFSEKKLDRFLSDLDEQIFSRDKREETQLIFEEFNNFWKAPDLTDQRRKQIVRTCNLLLDNRAVANPYYTNYFQCLMSFALVGHNYQSYQNWESAINMMLKSKKYGHRRADDIFEFTIDMLNDSTFYKTGAIEWKVNRNDYKFEKAEPIKITFPTLDLMYSSRGDTAYIYGTEGSYNPWTKQWKGKGGKIDWERAGMPKVYAELSNYSIDIKRPEFTADSAHLTYPALFDRKLLGRVEEKLTANVDPDDAKFPKFEAYEIVSLNEISKGVDYKGGFTLIGNKFIGANSEKTKGVVTIKKDAEIAIKAQAEMFVFTRSANRIVGDETYVMIPVEGDSIYHPGLNFKFKNTEGKRVLELTRDKIGTGRSPYFNTYHDLDMEFELLYWEIDNSEMEFRTLPGPALGDESDVVRAKFESSNIFNAKKYMRIQGMNQTHPFVYIKNFTKKNPYGAHQVTGLARYMRRSASSVRQLILDLYYQGFVSYNEDNDTFSPKQRLYYYLNASSRKKDYDVISFASNQELLTDKQNATLNMENKNLGLEGVDSVQVSAVQNVICIPNKDKIRVKKNRDFEFDGVLRAGLLEFEGKGFAFSYENFRFDMDSIQFMKIKVRTEWDSAQQKYTKTEWVQSRIENVSGFLLVDDPENKSGVKKNQLLAQLNKVADGTEKWKKLRNDSLLRYPIFNCTENSFVYYDQYYDEFGKPQPILSGIYKRDNFYFEVYPFTIDSVNDFAANSWEVPGYFESGIFPGFKQDLTIMEDSTLIENQLVPEPVYERLNAQGKILDAVPYLNAQYYITYYKKIYSLGFDREMQKYSVYDGKGNATNALRLSNKGLRGRGEIDYLTTLTKSEDFLYFPTTMVTDAYEFNVQEQAVEPQYADVKGTNNFVQWNPFKDEMLSHAAIGLNDITNDHWELLRADVTQKERLPFMMYYDQATLEGTLQITPDDHKGWGIMRFSNSELTSTQEMGGFNYDMRAYNADTANFAILPPGMNKAAFTAENVNSSIDYDKGQGIFKSNGEGSFAEFHRNLYKCYMEMFTWNIDANEIEIGTKEEDRTEGEERVGARYISTHPAQDTLSWTSYSTGYSLNDFILRAYEVDSINVANGSVYPSSTVVVRENAAMDQLTEAKIIADTTERHHTVYEAMVNIKGKYELQGQGKYDYIYLNQHSEGVDTITQTLLLPTIWSKKNLGKIEARGTIALEDSFKLNPYFVDFAGNFKIYGDKEFLSFTGKTSITHQCGDAVQPSSFNFSAEIDPNNAFIPLSKDINGESGRLDAGLFAAEDSIYSIFMSKPSHYTDVPIIKRDSGYIHYDRDNFVYEIASKEKIEDNDYPGNILSFSDRFCFMTGRGLMDLGNEFDPLDILMHGRIEHDFNKKEITADGIMALDFYFDKNALDLIVETILNDPTLNYSDPATPSYQNAVKRFLGKEKADELSEELRLYGRFKRIPDTLDRTMVLHNLEFKWDAASASLRSVGPIGIATVNGEQLYQEVDGYIEIVKKRVGDELNIYLELNPDSWFYFSYVPTNMFALSSNEEFNKMIRDAKNNRLKGTDYRFNIAEADAKRKFVRKMTGEGGDDDFDVFEDLEKN